MMPKSNINRFRRASKAPQLPISLGKRRWLLQRELEVYPSELVPLTKPQKAEWYNRKLELFQQKLEREGKRFVQSTRAAAEAVDQTSLIELRNPSSRGYQKVAILLRENLLHSIKVARMEMFRIMLLAFQRINWVAQDEIEKQKKVAAVWRRHMPIIMELMRNESKFIDTLNNREKFDKEVAQFIATEKRPSSPPWHPPRGA